MVGRRKNVKTTCQRKLVFRSHEANVNVSMFLIQTRLAAPHDTSREHWNVNFSQPPVAVATTRRMKNSLTYTVTRCIRMRTRCTCAPPNWDFVGRLCANGNTTSSYEFPQAKTIQGGFGGRRSQKSAGDIMIHYVARDSMHLYFS